MLLTREELWDKFLQVEKQIFQLKNIIQNPITPEFLRKWREQCDRSQNDLADILLKTSELVGDEIEAKQKLDEDAARTQYEQEMSKRYSK
jgi:predicted transcriptional regulator